MIGYALTERNKNWLNYLPYKNIYPSHQVYGMFFPISRLSKNAISFLYQKRLELISKKQLNGIEMPNDEVFVASQLCNNNFKYENLASKNFGSLFSINIIII